MVTKVFCFLYLIIIALLDVRTRRIPDSMTAGLFVTAFCADISFSFAKIPIGLLCGLLFSFVFFLVSACTKGLGMGDVKLAGVLGYCVGFARAAMTFCIASFTGIFFFLFVSKKKGKNSFRAVHGGGIRVVRIAVEEISCDYVNPAFFW